MESAASAGVDGSRDGGTDVGPALWTRADEVRAAVAQELARHGWSASVDLIGSATPELELVLEAEDTRERRRVKVPVTKAPVAAQVSHLLGSLQDDRARAPARRPSAADRWCAPA